MRSVDKWSSLTQQIKRTTNCGIFVSIDSTPLVPTPVIERSFFGRFLGYFSGTRQKKEEKGKQKTYGSILVY